MILRAGIFICCLVSVLVAAAAGLCTEKLKTPVPGRCSFYYTCENQNKRIEQCPFGHKFNPKVGECEWFWKVECKDTVPECKDGQFYKHPKSCRAYYSCEGGRLKTEFCPALYGFDGTECKLMTSCENSHTNDLINQLEYEDIELRGECNNGEITPHPNCLKFQKCVAGRWETVDCPTLQAFDARTKMCRFQDEAECSESSCIEGEKISIKQNCYKYYECVNSTRVTKDCGSTYFYYFDPQSLSCVFRPFKNCDSLWCADGTKKADDKDPKKYSLCKNGRWVDEYCEYKFDADKKQCTKCTDADRKEVANDKTSYRVCQNGNWVTLKCELKDQIYNPELKRCVSKNQIFQIRQKRAAGECVVGANSILYGYCHMYNKCNDKGELIPKKCPKDTTFDPDSKTCTKDGKCPVYEAIIDNCKNFKYQDRIKSCSLNPGDRFDTNTKQCVSFAAAHCATKNCEGHEKKNHPFDCTKYLECVNEMFVERQCSWWKWFDINTMDCKFWGPKCAKDKFNCADGDKLPISGNCKEYKECQNKEFTLESCWLWNDFDWKDKQCKGMWSAQCFTNSALSSNVILAATAECEEGASELLPGMCRVYKECVNGKWAVQKCSPCQNYNTETKKCDWVWKKPCSSDHTDPTGIPTIPTPSTLKPVCKDKEIVSIPEDCNHYKYCQDGQWAEGKCFLWGKFDKNDLSCYFWTFWKANCA